ncbi:MAG TPA: ATP-binding protein [Thermomicrobiales bacterium]|nr:ATP-binding protein [Thermomicrobiales bacterium]
MSERRSSASLWVRLLAGFATVLLLAVLATAFYSRHAAQSEFQRFVNRGQQTRLDNTAKLFAISYAQSRGSWDDAQRTAIIAAQLFGDHVVVTDSDGVVVADSADGKLLGQRFAGGDEWQQAAIVAERRRGPYGPAAAPPPTAETTLGTVYVENPGAAADRADFLGRLQRALFVGAGIGLLAALVVSLYLARRVGRPIELVTAAAHRMGQGDLAQRVPVGGGAEAVELAASFNRMAENLARSQELRQQLVADVAHELRTPLANIRGYLEAIEDGLVRADEATLQILREEAAQLNRLIDDLQELAQAEAGVLRLDRHPADLGELIEHTLAAARARATEREIALVAAAEPDLPPVEIDAQRIAQVLQNLLGNALRHTPPGGRIEVGARRAAPATVEVWVADTGSGIAPEDLPHVFERFYRADSSRSRATGGSGLGLTIARQLVLAHGGAIGATSEPGRGSRFTFTLPVEPAAPPAPAPRREPGYAHALGVRR